MRGAVSLRMGVFPSVRYLTPRPNRVPAKRPAWVILSLALVQCKFSLASVRLCCGRVPLLSEDIPPGRPAWFLPCRLEFQDAGGNSLRLKDASRPCLDRIASADRHRRTPAPVALRPIAMIYPTPVRMRPLSPSPMAAADAHPQTHVPTHTSPPAVPIGPRAHAIQVDSDSVTPRTLTDSAPLAQAENTTSQGV